MTKGKEISILFSDNIKDKKYKLKYKKIDYMLGDDFIHQISLYEVTLPEEQHGEKCTPYYSTVFKNKLNKYPVNALIELADGSKHLCTVQISEAEETLSANHHNLYNKLSFVVSWMLTAINVPKEKNHGIQSKRS
jgi:hypothetical protein